MTQPTILPRDIPSAVSNDEAIKLACLARDEVVLEMGSHYGFSTIVLAQEAKELHAVDWHLGDSMAGRGDNFSVYRENLRRYGVWDAVRSHVGPFEEVLPTMQDGHFDGCFLDGLHDDASVERDIKLLDRLVKPGGWVAFHDYGRFEVAGPVERYAASLGSEVEVVDHLAVVRKKKVMHDLVRAKIAHFTDLDRHYLRGVVHIGANEGQEIPWYIHMGHRPILAFEPGPAAFEVLTRTYAQHAICVNLALGDEDGELTLLIPADGDTQRFSKFQPLPWRGGPGHEWTHVPNTGGEVTVPVRRLDSWVRETCIDMSPFDVLVIDVQGMELEVLRGMGRVLDGFRFLNIECSGTPVYDGEASAQEVIDYLRIEGFEPETPIETHDDILFLRVRPPQVAVEPSGMYEWLRANGYPDLKDGDRVAPPLRRRYKEAMA